MKREEVPGETLTMSTYAVVDSSLAKFRPTANEPSKYTVLKDATVVLRRLSPVITFSTTADVAKQEDRMNPNLKKRNSLRKVQATPYQLQTKNPMRT